MVTTDGTLLGGRVRYRQPAEGFRSGIEPVLLAAAVPARENQRVLEAGTGAGAALLCLSARVPLLDATGVEINPALADLVRHNAAANGFGRLDVVTGAIETAPLEDSFDHVLANPPYHPAGTPSPDAEREMAKRGSETLLRAWIDRCGRLLRHRGSLTLVLPVASMPLALTAMRRADCPCTCVYPLWPKAGRPAKLILLQGMRQSRTPLRLMPGLVLHGPDGAYTEAAASILSNGAALNLEA